MRMAYAISHGEGTLLAYGVMDEEIDGTLFDVEPSAKEDYVTIITGPAENDPETGQ